jgi:hypothetical protein
MLCFVFLYIFRCFAETSRGDCEIAAAATAGGASRDSKVKEQMEKVAIVALTDATQNICDEANQIPVPPCPTNPLPPRITLHFQQLHSKNAGILLGDSSLADRSSGFSNSNPHAAFSSDLEREGGLVQKQQRAVTAAETCTLRRQ